MTRETFTLKLIPALVLGMCSGYAAAAGFALVEQNASGLGNSYAGAAAVAEDAGTIYFNPAGMALLPKGKKQLVVGLEAVLPSAKFSNNASTMPLLITANSTGNGGDAGDLAFLPQLFFAMPISDRMSVGVGFSAPFGLKTEYDSTWRGRFRAIKSDVKTMNINPSISYQASDTVSLGFGLSYQKIDAELTNASNVSLGLCAVPASAGVAALCGLGALNNLEAIGKVSGDDTGWGYNLGVIFQLAPDTRLGIAYRSEIKYHVTGTVEISRPTIVAGGFIAAPTAAALNAGLAANPLLADGPVHSDIKMPDSLNISLYKKLSDQWELMGDLSWTGWAKIQKLEFIRTNTNTVLSSTPENWRNTFRVGLGANYKLNDAWKLRGGIAYDQTPVKDEFRTPRLPDSDRTWLSIGAQYKLGKDGTLDFGYAHLFVKNGSINDNGGSAVSQAASGLLNGNYKNDVNILGAQYTRGF